MPHIVNEHCENHLHGDCLEVCPVEAFFIGNNEKRVLIDPEICIDCEACVSACPEGAILSDSLAEQKDIDLNDRKNFAASHPLDTEKLEGIKNRQKH